MDRIGVVGGGILGLAVARRLTNMRPGLSVTVFEKEDSLARHQSGHNSGVVHAGLYYPPGSSKATLCRRGVGLLRDYCTERELPYDECGKLVVALDATELAPLREIHRRGSVNGVRDLAMLDGPALREIEPNAAGVAGVHSPRTVTTAGAGRPNEFERLNALVLCAGLHSDSLALAARPERRPGPGQGGVPAQ